MMSAIYNHAIDKVKGWRKSCRYLSTPWDQHMERDVKLVFNVCNLLLINVLTNPSKSLENLKTSLNN
jgi:hypothetical protein